MPNLETKQECKCHTEVSCWNLRRLLSAAVSHYIGHLERKALNRKPTGEPRRELGPVERAWNAYLLQSRKADLESLRWIQGNLDSILR